MVDKAKGSGETTPWYRNSAIIVPIIVALIGGSFALINALLNRPSPPSTTTTPPTTSPSRAVVILEPSSISAGSQKPVTVKGSGFVEDAMVRITFARGGGFAVDSAVTKGAFEMQVTIPPRFTKNTYTVFVQGLQSGVVTEATFNVT